MIIFKFKSSIKIWVHKINNVTLKYKNKSYCKLSYLSTTGRGRTLILLRLYANISTVFCLEFIARSITCFPLHGLQLFSLYPPWSSQFDKASTSSHINEEYVFGSSFDVISATIVAASTAAGTANRTLIFFHILMINKTLHTWDILHYFWKTFSVDAHLSSY